MDLSNIICLIHPPVVLLPLILKKIRADHLTALLIALNWARQPWFPELLQMLVGSTSDASQAPSPVVPPISTCSTTPPVAITSLAVWPLSRSVTKQQAFYLKMLTSHCRRGEQPSRSRMQAPVRHGFTDVLNGVSVPF